MYCNLFFFSSSSSFPFLSHTVALWSWMATPLLWGNSTLAVQWPSTTSSCLTCLDTPPSPGVCTPESYPHQPAGGSRGTGPTGHTHAHWGRGKHSFKNHAGCQSFYIHKMSESSRNDPFSCAGIGSLRWSCSHYCVGWRMNFSSDRSPGLKAPFLLRAVHRGLHTAPERHLAGAHPAGLPDGLQRPGAGRPLQRHRQIHPVRRRAAEVRNVQLMSTHLLFAHLWFSNM